MSASNVTVMFKLSGEEKRLIKETLAVVDLDRIIDAFYSVYTAHPVTESFFEGHNIEYLKQKQVSHWKCLLLEGPTEEFLEQARTIGSVHEKTGIDPAIYLSGYSLVLVEIIDDLVNAINAKHALLRKDAIRAYCKLFFLDVAASMQSYVDHTQADISDDAISEFMDDAVKSSMGINQLFVNNLKASQAATRVNKQINSISAAIEEMSATVSTIADNTQKAVASTQDTTVAAHSGRHAADQAFNNMNTITSAVESASQKTAALADSTKKIEEIVTKIHGIANQTNLLALNATIEAARAGEAGRGFAVVANEVKQLSDQTSNATKEISTIIKGFIDHIQEIVASTEDVSKAVEVGREVTDDVKQCIEEIDQHAQEVANRMSTISSTLEEQSLASSKISNASCQILNDSQLSKDLSGANSDQSRDASNDMSHLINSLGAMSDGGGKAIIKLAKSDHVIWKRKMADLLLGKAEMKLEELSDHTQCRLGKWYYGTGEDMCGAMAAFKKLEAPHARVHKAGREAFELHQAHKHDAALEKLNELEVASEEVIALLNELDKLTEN